MSEVSMVIKDNVLTVQGMLDHSVVYDLEVQIIKLLENKANEVIIDLKNVNFISSACLGLFLVYHFNVAKEQRKISIVVKKEAVEFFSFANLDKILNVQVES